MDFALPPELAALKARMRGFVDEELIPRERTCTDGHKVKPDVRAELEARARERDLWMLHVPAALGGRSTGLLSKVVVWEEVGRSTALPPRAQSVFGPEPGALLCEQLDPAQRERYLFPLIRGEKKTAFAQTEPEAGSDPARLRTRAVRRGETYAIDGMKRYIGRADEADFVQLVAVTDPSKGVDGISVILVDMDRPGVRITRLIETMMRDRPPEIAFENVEVPVANLVGAEGAGFRLAQRWLTEGRIKHASIALGVIERCLELGTAQARERQTFGAPLADRQAVQWMLVDMYLHLHQLRLMTYQAAWKYDRGEDIRDESYMCKFFGDEASFAAADRCMQLHGGRGLTTELPIETMWHDQRAMIVLEGTTEVLKTTLARRILKEYRS